MVAQRYPSLRLGNYTLTKIGGEGDRFASLPSLPQGSDMTASDHPEVVQGIPCENDKVVPAPFILSEDALVTPPSSTPGAMMLR